MAFVLGTLQQSAYERIFLGLWAVGISTLFATGSLVCLALSRLSGGA